MKNSNKKYAAIAMCLIIGLAATKSTDWQSALLGRTVIGGPMVALVISMILCNLLPGVSADFKAGTTFSAKKFLNIGTILTGATLSFAELLGTGVKALPLIIINIVTAFCAAIFMGKRLAVSRNTSVLVGGGTAICGGTAIATLARIIKAHEEEIAFAMAAIFLFDNLEAFSYTYAYAALGLTDNQFAFLGGAAINDASSVAGAQATFAALKGLGDWNGAMNVKLVRTTMLIFVALFWTFASARAEASGSAEKESLFAVVKKSFPLFILGFVAMAALNTLGVFSFTVPVYGKSAASLLGKLSKFFFASALAGVGFKIKFKDVFSKGAKPILLGGITWLCILCTSLIFIFVFKGYVG
jgi:uncharacterized integral membrane protein (TIGR00698 family)